MRVRLAGLGGRREPVVGVRLPALAATMVMTAGALAGCSTGGDGGSPSADSSPTPPPAPRAGQCYDAGEEAFERHIDRSKPVDCSAEHTLETARVIVTHEPITPDTVSRHAAACRTAFADYVGGSPEVSRLAVHVVVADDKTQAAGGHWLRCDVVAKLDTKGKTPERRTDSVKGALASGVPTELWACLNAPPDPDTNQRYVPCTEPHVAELLPEAITVGTAGEPYPGPKALDRRAERACNRLITAAGYPDHIGTNWAYPAKENWAAGDRDGACWVTATLPPIDTETNEKTP